MSSDKIEGQGRVIIRQLPTGVPGLDEILGGGLPEYSFNIIAGAPGSGKTTLAHQIMFANATPERPALYFTVLGEPAIKMLRYQQQFTLLRPGQDGRRGDPLRQPQPDRAGTGPRRGPRCDHQGGRGVPRRASSWWIRSAPWCARRVEPSRAKWSFRASSSAWRCT